MAQLTPAASFKDVISAILPPTGGSPILNACRVRRQVPTNWTFERKPQVPANAIGFSLVNLTQAIVDPNGKPFVEVDETFAGTHVVHPFQGAPATVIATAVAGIEALVLAALLTTTGKLDVPSQQYCVFFGRAAMVTTVNALTQRVNIECSILVVSDAGPLGRFIVPAQAAQVKT